MINFTIILADDEQQILYGMKNGIDWESLGFSVVGTAQNGKEALELIEEYHPDLLISDIKMPFMDGLELSKTIHENYINTKIILFSGWDDFEYARTAISYGVSQYIMKPIDYNEMQKLLTTMHEELEKEYAEKMNRTRLATEFIETKKEKYDSPIAQGGSNVSGGQKQRLAIARAIAKKAKVLVFDDSFSALDMKTDAALRKELNEKVQDASIVIVAQRVSTILHADQILVLDDGKIVGKGTHEELLKNCEVYLQIAKSQLSEKELGLEKLGLAEEKAEKETNKKEILSTKIDEKENNKLKEKSDDKKLKHKKGGK